MELLSRRSSGSRISTLKRSRSFRASMKLMSKIRNHANLRLAAGFDLSSVSKDLIVKKGCNLSVLEEIQDSEKLSNLQKGTEDMNSHIKDKIDNEASSSPRKISVSDFDADSQKITKDLKSKLSLTDKLIGMDRKNVERPCMKNEDVKLPKLIHIFRRRHSIGSSQEDTREKDHSDKHATCETNTDGLNKYVFYENPTFVLDNSLDSSVSSFLYEVEEGNEVEQWQKQDGKNEGATSSKRNVLTVVVDSHKTATNRPFYRKTNYERDKDEDEEYLKKPLQNTFRPRCETESLRCSCEVRSDDSHAINVINGNRKTTESLSEFDRLKIKFYCKMHETKRKNAALCLQNQKIHDDAKIYPSKSCKVKTVDNITNFWTNRRGNSFRNKMATGRKRDIKETKDYERIGQEQVFVSTSSGSKFHSLQGMEFLEGFGKKKQQLHHLNNLSSIHINPLSTQSLNIHLHALFAAVEHGHLDKARTILESTDVNINSVNSDGLSPLDVAVLSNNRLLAKMLVAFGAQEGNQFKSPESLGNHLASLLSEAEHRVQELGGSTSDSGGTNLLEPPCHRATFSTQHNNLTGCSGSTEDKQLALWERRSRALRKMLLGFDQARPPDIPFLVAIDVTGTTSVTVRFQEPDSHDSPICTKFKVQWSLHDDFSVICGEREVLDMKQKECRIENLTQGKKYHFRAAAGNLKGYSRFRNSTPAHVTPSSWRDIDGRMPRFAGRLEQLNTLFTDIRRPEYTQETPAVQRRNHKKKTTIKQLFTATSKFQKNLRRGVFLACLLYHEDKVLVTNEDFLPVIEIDETYPSCIYNDFHWLMKVACTWDDVKSLRQDMEKSHSSSTNHFRIKLLQAAAQMQAALCIQDLGQLYHKPIRDIQGTLVLSTVNYINSPKLISVLNSRWLPLSKVIKKVITHEDSNVADILMASIQEQMTYHQVSSIKLSKGLYLGYLKMQSSVDLIQVVVPTKSPNVLPHCKIRDNPHVSAEEWDYLKKVTRICTSETSMKESEEKENVTNEALSTEQQKLFVDLVAATARRLFNYMEISPDDLLMHRLYDAEVIDLTHDVSFLIAVPPAETACCVPGTREILLQRGDLLSLPIQVFEMVHLNTYQKDVINRYSRLSCILELDTAQAQHNHREAFSSLELSVAKDKLARLQDLQSQVNTVWKGARWLIDVITFARDRGSSQQNIATQTVGISMKHLLSLDRNKNSNSNSLKRSLLQLPPRDPKLVKSSPGRGSWPGPNLSKSPSNLMTEFSKSEQQLPSGQYIRKGSNTSNASVTSEPQKSLCAPISSSSNLTTTSSANHLIPLQNMRLPPSKSEDTLIFTKYKHSPRNRSATITSASANTSPLLSVKPIIYSGSLLSVSTAITNTTSLLSVSNTNSDSLHSLSSDEYSATNSGACLKPGHPVKVKTSKPTASVAAMAAIPSDNLTEEKEEAMMPAPLPGILQVYAAYETGLAAGTSLKLHVTPRTTAREVVDLVVKQLNMAVVLKGQKGPTYTTDELPNFCLVAVIGARERCLRDDFKPLQLQNPWKKGRLYVRQKQDVLAALEHSSKHTAYL
ncbi:Ankyrin repeat and fibronectin type-III domain-containing protein 1 [Cyphomyrmex costatus]|uniref:Ankyrin repeat and fibronectin type-III domain-containing protein 1 n=2 Tax=Cyphomyrmex costatus TaxID=456900 RepID=A0A151IG01_9HYME|nr:Ankyrin repeat and fibronectin type-III domain-containing protein 1 [Cyphomyrmex costatus]